MRNDIIHVATTLFKEQGYATVSLNDIAQRVGIRKPSLYHHFPRGKEEIYLASILRLFENFREMVEETASLQVLLEEKLYRIAEWFDEHYPLSLISMMHQDMPKLSTPMREELFIQIREQVFLPIVDMLSRSMELGEIERRLEPTVATGSILALIEGAFATTSLHHRPVLMEQLRKSLTVFVDGLRCKGGKK